MAVHFCNGQFLQEKNNKNKIELYFLCTRIIDNAKGHKEEKIRLNCLEDNKINYETFDYICRSSISKEDALEVIQAFLEEKSKDSYQSKIDACVTLEEICILLYEFFKTIQDEIFLKQLLSLLEEKMEKIPYNISKLKNILQNKDHSSLSIMCYYMNEIYRRYEKNDISEEQFDVFVNTFIQKIKRLSPLHLNVEDVRTLLSCGNIFTESSLKNRRTYIKKVTDFTQNIKTAPSRKKQLYRQINRCENDLFPQITFEEYSQLEYFVTKGKNHEKQMRRNKRIYFDLLKENKPNDVRRLLNNNIDFLESLNIFTLSIINQAEKMPFKENNRELYFILSHVNELEAYTINRLAESFSKGKISCQDELLSLFYQVYQNVTFNKNKAYTYYK